MDHSVTIMIDSIVISGICFESSENSSSTNGEEVSVQSRLVRETGESMADARVLPKILASLSITGTQPCFMLEVLSRRMTGFQGESCMLHRAIFISMIAFFMPAGATLAEKANMAASDLSKTATHLIVGKVAAVYERTETTGDWKYTKYVAEIRVSNCEKGEGLKKGDLVYARYWNRAWQGRGPMPPSTSGHRGLPAAGDTVRVYLARNAYDGFDHDNKDGGFNVIGANGFEKLQPEPER